MGETQSFYGIAAHSSGDGTGIRAEGLSSLPQIRIGSAKFYKWKSRYGDLEVSEAKRLKALEDGGMIGRSQRVDQSMVNAAG